VASGKWQVASGKWQVASGKWQVASGKQAVSTHVFLLLLFPHTCSCSCCVVKCRWSFGCGLMLREMSLRTLQAQHTVTHEVTSTNQVLLARPPKEYSNAREAWWRVLPPAPACCSSFIGFHSYV